MKLFRLLGLVIAVFRCAAMVLVPVAAAAEAGEGTNRGSNPMQQGPGKDHPPGGFGNLNASANRTLHAPGTGNVTAPPDLPEFGNGIGKDLPPDWNADNSTARGNMTMHRPWSGNLTGRPIPPDWNADNSTATNQTRHGPGNGNLTMPEPSLQDQQSVQDQMNDTGELIAQLVTWLKSPGVS